jgi:hypothetical protein
LQYRQFLIFGLAVYHADTTQTYLR